MGQLLLTIGELSRCANNLSAEVWAGIRAAAGLSPEHRPPNRGAADWLAHMHAGVRLDAAVGRLCAALEPDYWPVYPVRLQ